MMISRIALFAAISSCLTPMAQAQSDDALDRILSCRTVEDIEARLLCFDTAAASLAEARSSGEIMTVTNEDVEAVERDSFGFHMPSLPRFRLPMFTAQASADQTPAPSRTHDALDDSSDVNTPAPETSTVMADAGSTATAPETPAPEEEVSVAILERNDDGGVFSVSMRIEGVRTVGYNTSVFYMENGQVWRQTDNGRVRVPRNQDNLTAEIRRGAMSSYLLRINGQGRAIRVERQR